MVVFSLDEDNRYRIQGFIDRLDQQSDGTYEVHDYKTNQRVPTQEEADADRQLALYQIGVQQMWSDAADVDLAWHYVHQAIEPLRLVRLSQCVPGDGAPCGS